MASGRTNYMPPYIDPTADWDTRMRGVAGGDPNFFRYGRFGLLTDNSRLKQGIEGNAPSAPSNSYTGGGASSLNFSGGKTSTNPGAYNWDTFTRNLDRASGVGWGVVDWRMKDKRMAAKKAKDSNYVTTYQQQANKALGHMAPNYSSWYQQQATSQTSGNSQATQQRRPGRRSPYSGPQPPAPPVP